MNIIEVFEKCNNGDYVIDNYKRRWKVDNGELTVSCLWPTFYNLYTLKEITELQFKKVYDVDWSKVEVDTKILVSNNNKKWYRRYFAKYENDEVFAFMNGTTSYTDNTCTTWKYAKLYEEGK